MTTAFLRNCLLITAMASSSLIAGSSGKVLIYTRNHVSEGKGFVHDNIGTSVAALKEICAGNGITCDASDNPEVFTPENLKQYGALIFSNSNNEAFSDPAQSKAFIEFVENGGGFVGIHSASGSERKNPEFKRVLGGRFVWHTLNQKFTVVVADKNHPSTASLPERWEWKDEGYLCDLEPNLHVLLEMDATTITSPKREAWKLKFEGDRFPLAWCHTVGKGRSFYTALGHDKEAYADPAFRKHLEGGILWCLGNKQPSSN